MSSILPPESVREGITPTSYERAIAGNGSAQHSGCLCKTPKTHKACEPVLNVQTKQQHS